MKLYFTDSIGQQKFIGRAEDIGDIVEYMLNDQKRRHIYLSGVIDLPDPQTPGTLYTLSENEHGKYTIEY